MAKKASTAPKSLNVANLETLGAARLAALLMEITAGDAAARRRLKLAIAGEAGPAATAHAIAKRLASIARSKTFLERHQVDPLARELKAQHDAILKLVAPSDPRQAFDLIWQLLTCAGPVFERSDDSDGRLSSAFEFAIVDLGPLAEAAKLDPDHLVDRSFLALQTDGDGVWQDLIPILAPRLGAEGLVRLREMTLAWRKEPVATPPEHERRVIGWSSSSGKIYADSMEKSHRRHVSDFVLKQIADASRDVDAYIAQIDARSRKFPPTVAEIARRLLDAGRAGEALKILNATEHPGHGTSNREWQRALTDALEAVGQHEEAQDFRWKSFLETLNTEHLRTYLLKLPDFQDQDAEQKALSHAQDFDSFEAALSFLIQWPDLHRASQIVLSRAQILDGRRYEVLTPAADALDEKYPLAASLARRAMIDFTLKDARSTRYKHAARHLRTCANLARRIADFGSFPTHKAYEQTLKAAHGRKAAFWDEVPAR